LIKHFDCVILKQETLLFCTLEIGVPKNSLEEVMDKIKELRGVEMI